MILIKYVNNVKKSNVKINISVRLAIAGMCHWTPV